MLKITDKKRKLPSLLIIFSFILSISLLAIFSKLAYEVRENETISFDKSVIKWLHSFNTPWVEGFMLMITRAGSVIWIEACSLVIIFWLYFKKKNNRDIIFFLVVVAGGGAMNYILKQVFHRTRPLIDLSVGAVGFSFPSGHAMGAMVFYSFCGYLIIYSEIDNRIVKAISGFILFLFIILIGISRIYLNAHYPSDVIGGYLAGLIWILLCINSLKLYKWRKDLKS